LALRDRGQESVAALDMLAAALQDSDAGVRMMAANALAAIGREAAPAVPALIDAASAEGQQVHVLRSVAAALGAIGKPAAPALPALRKIAQIPRAKWSADAAIRAIE